MTGLTNAYIWGEGATIDRHNFNNTRWAAIDAPYRPGRCTGHVGRIRTGYRDTPYVQVSGGDGVGVMAIPTINYTTVRSRELRSRIPALVTRLCPRSRWSAAAGQEVLLGICPW